MRILFVNTKYGFWGGVEKYIFKTAGLLKENGYEIYGLFEQSSENLEDFESAFDKCIIYKNESLSQLKEKIGKTDIVFIHKITNNRLLKMLIKNFITLVIIHDHDYYCIRHHKYFPVNRKNCHRPFGLMRCSICSKLLERSDGRFPVRLINIFQRKRTLKLIRNANAFFVLSEFMRSNLVMNKFKKESIYKIYPFIETKECREKLPAKTAELLYIGQIIRGKGVDLLIEIVRYINKPFHLSIVGKGNDEESIKQLIEEYGLQDKVEFVGWTSKVDPYYNKADVLLVPSRWQEPFGLIGIEAFSHQKPVIGFDVGGIGEWLKNGVNGYLIPETDIKQFAEKIEELINNPGLMKKMGKAGYDLIEKKYQKENFLEAFNKILETI